MRGIKTSLVLLMVLCICMTCKSEKSSLETQEKINKLEAEISEREKWVEYGKAMSKNSQAMEDAITELNLIVGSLGSYLNDMPSWKVRLESQATKIKNLAEESRNLIPPKRYQAQFEQGMKGVDKYDKAMDAILAFCRTGNANHLLEVPPLLKDGMKYIDKSTAMIKELTQETEKDTQNLEKEIQELEKEKKRM